MSGGRIIARTTKAALDAAIAAHTPDPLFGASDEERQLGALEAKMRAVWNSTDTFPAAQMQRLAAGLGLMALRARKRP